MKFRHILPLLVHKPIIICPLDGCYCLSEKCWIVVTHEGGLCEEIYHEYPTPSAITFLPTIFSDLGFNILPMYILMPTYGTNSAYLV
ncbi:hypothetical protein C0J52_19871 [Blattella germanica]|nr:hypothetical protein C0J52_19871 [Blattella germanica]